MRSIRERRREFMKSCGWLMNYRLSVYGVCVYRKRGYDEVRTPLLYDKQLWQTCVVHNYIVRYVGVEGVR
jgi:threonyl-tRNA synthetase